MTVTAESYGHVVILNIKGELTEDTLAAFEQSVDRCLLEKAVIDLVLNLEQVPLVDSKALEYLLDLQDRLAERMGQVKLLRCDENVRKILEITHLEATFETYKDVPESVKAIQA
jgi:anti-anti-sigma factor